MRGRFGDYFLPLICKSRFLFQQKGDLGNLLGVMTQRGDAQAEVLVGEPGVADLLPPFSPPLSGWRKEGGGGAGREDVHTLGRMNPAAGSVRPQLRAGQSRTYIRVISQPSDSVLSLVLSGTVVTLAEHLRHVWCN